MQCFKPAAAAAMLLAFAGLAQAASLGSTGYTENFDELGSTGKTLPADWSVWASDSGSHSSWTTAITANGSTSVASMVASNVTAALLDSAITNSTKSSSAYNIADAATPADRALATSPTSIAGVALQLSLANDTGNALNGVFVSYDIEKYYDGSKQSSLTSGLPVGEELPGYQLFYSIDGGSWVNVAALDPVSAADGVHPVVAAGTPSNNGVVGPVGYGVTSVGQTWIDFAGASLATGQTLRLRWVDDNAVNISPDQIIALDNVSVSAVPEPESIALMLVGLGVVGTMARRRRSGARD